MPILSAGSIFASDTAVKTTLLNAMTAMNQNPGATVINIPTPRGNLAITIAEATYIQLLPLVINGLETYAGTDYNQAEIQLKTIRTALQAHRAAQYTGIWTNILGYCGKAPRIVTTVIDPEIEDVNTALRNIYWTQIVTGIANKRDDVLFVGYQAGKVAAVAAIAILAYRNRATLYYLMPKSLPTFFGTTAKAVVETASSVTVRGSVSGSLTMGSALIGQAAKAVVNTAAATTPIVAQNMEDVILAMYSK